MHPPFTKVTFEIQQPYDFVIKYFLSTKIPIPDALSRVSPQKKGEIKVLDFTTHALNPHLTRVYVQQIQKATQADTHFRFHSTNVGWLA